MVNIKILLYPIFLYTQKHTKYNTYTTPYNSCVTNAQKLSKNCVNTFWFCHLVSSQRRNCDKLNHWHHQVLKIRFILRHFEVFVLDRTQRTIYMWRVPKMTQKFIAWGVFATHKQATDGATFYSGSQ